MYIYCTISQLPEKWEGIVIMNCFESFLVIHGNIFCFLHLKCWYFASRVVCDDKLKILEHWTWWSICGYKYSSTHGSAQSFHFHLSVWRNMMIVFEIWRQTITEKCHPGDSAKILYSAIICHSRWRERNTQNRGSHCQMSFTFSKRLCGRGGRHLIRTWQLSLCMYAIFSNVLKTSSRM